MSLRLEMLQVARLAPRVLKDATGLVRDFLRRQHHPDGGFKNRDGDADLYYTVFGLDALTALQASWPLEPVRRYLRSFGHGRELDLVHLCCLARCWSAFPGGLPEEASAMQRDWVRHLERFRAKDGGYHPKPGHRFGSAYGAFLALGARQDFGVPLQSADRLAKSFEKLATDDGAYTNERVGVLSKWRCRPHGATNATAAAVMVLRQLGVPVPESVRAWLRRQFHPQGGFRAAPHAPLPDLLSTATTLHSLVALEMPIEEIRDPCLDFIDSLWTNEGAFYSNWTDHQLDCEYAFYGLLALGHLSF